MDDSEQRALLQAVLHNPDDDLPRLAYCDWLEERTGYRECPVCNGTEYVPFRPKTLKGSGREGLAELPAKTFPAARVPCRHCKAEGRVSNGNAERAQFIRVQLEREKPPPKWSLGTPEKPGLFADQIDAVVREQKLIQLEMTLFDAHKRDWFPPPPSQHYESYVGMIAVNPTITVDSISGSAFVRPPSTVRSRPYYRVNRGFVEEVAVSRMVDWTGGPCPQCRGTGQGGGYRPESCFDCQGHGHGTLTIGEIVATQPVRRVIADDRRPRQISLRSSSRTGKPIMQVYWEPGFDFSQPHQVSFETAKAGGWKASMHGGLMVYEFEDAMIAHEALSEALVKQARATHLTGKPDV